MSNFAKVTRQLQVLAHFLVVKRKYVLTVCKLHFCADVTTSFITTDVTYIVCQWELQTRNIDGKCTGVIHMILMIVCFWCVILMFLFCFVFILWCVIEVLESNDVV